MGRIGRRVYRSSLRRSNILDKQLAVRDLLKYGGYGAAAILVVLILFLVPYKLGQASVACPESRETITSTATELLTVPDESANRDTIEPVVEEAEEPGVVEEVEEPAVEEEVEEAEEEEPYDFAKYSNVDLDLGDVTFDIRGEDWGTVQAIELIIENGEIASVYPAKIYAKIHEKESSPLDWWDDETEVDLKISKDDIYRGDITLHMSFSDLSNEKIVTIEIRDENDLLMARKEKTVSFG